MSVWWVIAGWLLSNAALVWWLDAASRWREWRNTRAFQKSGRETAKAGPRIPPSVEVWAAGHGVYDQDDPILRHIEAMWDMPAAWRGASS